MLKSGTNRTKWPRIISIAAILHKPGGNRRFKFLCLKKLLNRVTKDQIDCRLHTQQDHAKDNVLESITTLKVTHVGVYND